MVYVEFQFRRAKHVSCKSSEVNYGSWPSSFEPWIGSRSQTCLRKLVQHALGLRQWMEFARILSSSAERRLHTSMPSSTSSMPSDTKSPPPMPQEKWWHKLWKKQLINPHQLKPMSERSDNIKHVTIRCRISRAGEGVRLALWSKTIVGKLAYS